MTVYKRLFDVYGPQHWWPGDTPFEIMVRAILTQNTAWSNVERALERLTARAPISPEALLRLPPAELAGLELLPATQLTAYFAAHAPCLVTPEDGHRRGDRLHPEAVVPAPENLDLLGELALIAFERQDVIPTLIDDLLRDLLLATHGIDGDNAAFEHQHLEQLGAGLGEDDGESDY